MNALSQIFIDTARKYPGRPALWADGCLTTYQELHAAASRLAAVILSATPSREYNVAGGRCGLLVHRARLGYIAILGALFAGCTYVPLNLRFPITKLRAILAASEIDVMIIDRASIGLAEALVSAYPRTLTILLPNSPDLPDWAGRAGHHRFVCRDEIDQSPAILSPPSHTDDDGAYLLFTSGSTGEPKGVLIRHGNLIAYLGSVLRRYQPNPEDRFTQLFDFSFDLSAHDMFVCWSSGACLYCPPAGALVSPREFVRKHNLTFWFSVPSTAATMARLRTLTPGVFPSLRVSLFCGEALPAGLAQLWRRAAPNSIIENLYGPTEATIAITAYRVPNEDTAAQRQGVVPIGLPFPGQHAQVIDTEGKPVPDGTAGELCIGGSQVASGYWRLPDLTDDRFVGPLGYSEVHERWYRTGDRVVKDRELGFLFLGRLDRQVKIRGQRVDLQEIEAIVRGLSGSKSVAALAWPDGLEPARAIVIFVAGEDSDANAIMADCRERLPSALVPRQIHFLTNWPLNGNGKTDYSALQRMLIGNHGK